MNLPIRTSPGAPTLDRHDHHRVVSGAQHRQLDKIGTAPVRQLDDAVRKQDPVVLAKSIPDIEVVDEQIATASLQPGLRRREQDFEE